MAAAIEAVRVSDLGPGLGGIGTSVLNDVKDRVLAEAKKAGWRWFTANQDRVLYSKKILFFPTINLRVRDLRFVFVELFGADTRST